MNHHWTEDDFLNELYGIGPGDGHLETCPECRAQFEQIAAARRDLLSEQTEVPSTLLTAQRHKLAERMEATTTARPLRWAPVLAMAGVLVIAVIWKSPAPVSAPPVKTTSSSVQQSDSRLMADILQTAFDPEPDALAPLHGLFQAKQPKESKK